jgi:hypothetical protein
MTDLVPEMSDDGAEGLAQPTTQIVPVTVVGLGEIQRHDTVEVTGDAALPR